MSEKLTDPSKAAHEIIEVLSGGDAIRNDGVRLGAANKNPWYVLATIYGEQEEGASWLNHDEELAAKNRRAWNGWYCGGLSEEQRKDRAKEIGVSTKELAPLWGDELKNIQTLFQARMNDENAEFPNVENKIEFDKIYFSTTANFTSFVFTKECDLSEAHFAKNALFVSASFYGNSFYIQTEFKGHADFRHATFDLTANFRMASFCGTALFSHVTFVSNSCFASTTFYAGASFEAATFKGSADFEWYVYIGLGYYKASHPVQFFGAVDFRKANFESHTRFADAHFLTHVPELHAAELYDDTVFPARDKDQKNWPPLRGSVKIGGERIGVMDAAEQKRAYNRLRLFMSKSLQIDEEQFFHRQEMRCKAVLAKWYHKPLYWLFAIFSDYGNSVWRPVAWGAFSVVAAALFMLWWQGVFAFTPQNDAGFDWAFGLLNDGDVWAKPREAFGWSISNALPFLGSGKYFTGVEFAKELAWPLRVVGGVQTLFGFVLLFLFGLGLRNRFRLR